MLYEKDFKYLTRWRVKNVRNSRESIVKNKSLNEKLKIVWKTFCQNTTIHGMKYLAKDSLRTRLRLLWAVLISTSVSFMIYYGAEYSRQFVKETQTVIDTTVYGVYKIPFPTITICNYNRINWLRINEAKRKFIPNATQEIEEIFEKFVISMEKFRFGSFERYEEFKTIPAELLDHLNITEISSFMAFRCSEMFESQCWWRYGYRPCCELFKRSKSELGFCHSFNSAFDLQGNPVEESEQYPYKSSSFGEWGGLRIPLAISAESVRRANEHLVEQGIVVIVHYPYQWPSSGLFIPMGSASSVLLKPKLSYADEETRRMPPEVRECVFPDETEQPKYESLPGLKYLKQNCLSNCRQEYLLKYCNCTVEMFFPPANFTPCKASDYRCLAENDKIFNYEKMEEEEKYINSSGEGMVCTCLHECYSIDYQEEVLPFHLAKVENFSRKILLNVFYQHNTILKYRMNVVFGWQDLLVSFGGIAGLFLGSSLLSGVEVIYYLTIGLAVYLESIFHKKSTKNKKAKFTNSNTPAKPKKVIKVKPSKILLGVRIPPTNTKNKF